jgi:MtfA peptidase
MSLWARFDRWREARALERYRIPDSVWTLVLGAYPFVQQRSEHELYQLRCLCSLFLARKEFSGMQGLEVDDNMAVAIAAQACLPLLHLPAGLSLYDGMVGIVVHQGEVVAQREEMDDDGVVHRYDEPLSGEAMEGGPVMLAWSDVASAGASAELAYNVVIHEFAHVLDMASGPANGMPPQADAANARAWAQTLDREFDAFCQRVDADDPTLLDPYGAQSPVEFFAVALEAFFVAAQAFRSEHPALHQLFCRYFRQDPAQG